jgi:hypothetical protein
VAEWGNVYADPHLVADPPLGAIHAWNGGRWLWRCAACGRSSIEFSGTVATYRYSGTAGQRLREHALFCRARVARG